MLKQTFQEALLFLSHYARYKPVYAKQIIQFAHENKLADSSIWFFDGFVSQTADGNMSSAIEKYNRAIDAEKTNKMYHAALANAHHILHQYQDAIDHYKRALELDVNYSRAHFGLGICYFHLNREVEAAKHMLAASRYLRRADSENSVTSLRMELGCFEVLQELMQNNPQIMTALEKFEESGAPVNEMTSKPLQKMKTGVINLEFEHYDDLDHQTQEKPEFTIVKQEESVAAVESGKMHIDITASEAGIVLEVPPTATKLTTTSGTNHNYLIGKIIPMSMNLIEGEPVQAAPFATMEQVVTSLTPCKKIVALTGSGISSASGLKTRKQLWNTLSREQYVANWMVAKDPSKLWQLVDMFLNDAEYDPKPNAAHFSLAKLEQMGLLSGIVTQNVDNLHQLAGNTNIIEMHGTLEQTYCSTCHVPHGTCKSHLQNMKDIVAPTCPSFGSIDKCVNYTGTPGYLRPDVVLFGELVHPTHLQQAIDLLKDCDALLVIGTAMDVTPSSELPLLAQKLGKIVVEVKRKPSRISNHVTHFLSGEAETVLPQLVEELERAKKQHQVK